MRWWGAFLCQRRWRRQFISVQTRKICAQPRTQTSKSHNINRHLGELVKTELLTVRTWCVSDAHFLEFQHTWQLRTNYQRHEYNSKNFLYLSKQCHWTSKWRWLFRQFVLDLFVEFPDLFGSFDVSPTMWIVEHIRLHLNWFSIDAKSLCVLVGFLGVSELPYPFFIRYWMKIHLSQTQNWISVDMYRDFRPRDYLIVTRNRSRPSGGIPYQRRNVQDFK